MTKINRASAIIIGNKNSVVLIHRIKNEQEYYSLPGGGIEKNESADQAILREISEELGIKINKIIEISSKQNDKRQDVFFFCEADEDNFIVTGPEVKYLHNKKNLFEPLWINKNNLNKSLPIYPEGSLNLLKKYTNLY